MLNSAMHYKWNKTGTYIKSLSSFKLKFLRKQARILSASKLQKNIRAAQAEYDRLRAAEGKAAKLLKQEKKQRAAKILASTIPILSISALKVAKLTIPALDLQLAWHRQFNTDMSLKKDLGKKELKTVELVKAINALNMRGDRITILEHYRVQRGSEDATEQIDGEWEDEQRE